MKIIAEIGVNHDGNILEAKRLIKISKDSGADYVKFQMYKTVNIVIKKSKSASYQKKVNKNQFKLLKKYEITLKNFKKLINYCKKININSLTTCFDIETFNNVKKISKSNIYKIGSGDLDNLPLIYEIAKNNKKIILSTGMSSFKDIDLALKTIYFAQKYKKKNPNLEMINSIKLNTKNKKFLLNKVILLHCASNYPTKLIDLNLKIITVLKDKYHLQVGLSDHSKSLISPSIAFLLGAEFIEKHLTISNTQPGPDHSSSLNKTDFKKMVENLKDTIKMLGTSKKSINKFEKNIAQIAKKSLYASKEIYKDEVYTFNNLALKRPQLGKKPKLFWNYLGKKAKKSYKTDEMI